MVSVPDREIHPPYPKLWRWLTPMSWCYSGVMAVRNRLFDWGILPQKMPPVLTICVGNLSVGGTGKTPHTEWLARFLSEKHACAILSRGYGRSTHGFRIVTPDDTPDCCGDEPLQMKRKAVAQVVAVCENRRKGVAQILAHNPQVDSIILDDAYQHRYVGRHINLLLTDFNRLYALDLPLPAGRLRESRKGAQRADIIVVTKCPADMSDCIAAQIGMTLKPNSNQHLLFSTLRYDAPYPIAQPQKSVSEMPEAVLLVSGIAHNDHLISHLEAQGIRVETLAYADHHRYTAADLQTIRARLESIPESRAALLTTEKDAVKLLPLLSADTTLLERTLVQPVGVEFLFGGDETIKQLLAQKYVQQSQNTFEENNNLKP